MSEARYILVGFGEGGQAYHNVFDLPFDTSKDLEWEDLAESKDLSIIETEEDLIELLGDPEFGRSVLLKFYKEYPRIIRTVMTFDGDYPEIDKPKEE